MHTATLDGITGPQDQCTCNHCQMDDLIDQMVAQPTEKEEEADGQDAPRHIDIYQQVAS